jgi:hypothetical protein
MSSKLPEQLLTVRLLLVSQIIIIFNAFLPVGQPIRRFEQRLLKMTLVQYSMSLVPVCLIQRATQLSPQISYDTFFLRKHKTTLPGQPLNILSSLKSNRLDNFHQLTR